MAKLKRGWINVKRLATICVNKIIRTKWLLDYIKGAVKPLEYINIMNNNLFKKISTYTLYNGQKLSLKTFIDDNYDVAYRRTLIEEGNEESYSFYGYVDSNGNYVDEIDPNLTSFNGYGSAFTYTLETGITNLPLYGYNMFNPGTNALQDVDLEYILDNYYEYIYTSEDNGGGSNNYVWFLESKTTEGLVIYLHEDIYNSLSIEQLETLQNIIGKYIIQPISYKIDKYN